MSKTEQIRPSYYGNGQNDPYEAIKVINAWGKSFSISTAIKYLARVGEKGTEEDAINDLKKAITYLEMEIANRTETWEQQRMDYWNNEIAEAVANLFATIGDVSVPITKEDEKTIKKLQDLAKSTEVEQPKFKIGDKVVISSDIKAEDYENSDIGWDETMEYSLGHEGSIVLQDDDLDQDTFWVQPDNTGYPFCFYAKDLILIDCKTEDSLKKDCTEIDDESLASNINILTNKCYQASKNAGWHDNPRETGTMLALIHSEISEAMEGDRKGLMDDHLKNRTMFEAELADAVIRICDLAGSKGIPLGEVILEKLKYNESREDHKRENRAKEGGKKY